MVRVNTKYPAAKGLTDLAILQVVWWKRNMQIYCRLTANYQQIKCIYWDCHITHNSILVQQNQKCVLIQGLYNKRNNHDIFLIILKQTEAIRLIGNAHR